MDGLEPSKTMYWGHVMDPNPCAQLRKPTCAFYIPSSEKLGKCITSTDSTLSNDGGTSAGLTMIYGPMQPRSRPAAEGQQSGSVGRKVGVQK